MKFAERHIVIFFIFLALIIGVFFVLADSINIINFFLPEKPKIEKPTVKTLSDSAEINYQTKKSSFHPPEVAKAIFDLVILY